MKVYTDIFTAFANPGYMIYGIGRSGSVDHLGNHMPWFMVYARSADLTRVRETLSKLIKNGLVIEYVEHDPNIVTPLILRKFRYEPDTSFVPIEIRCRKKEVVPKVAESIRRAVGSVFVGEHNIVYPVRVSFDYDVKFFHEMCPLLFVPNSELESVSLELIERYRNFKILSFDIEVYTTSGRFPVPGDPILSLQYAVTTLDNPDVSDPSWVYDAVQTFVAKKADQEESKEIVKNFLDVLRKERPDVIVGYNSVSFDLKYLKPFLGMRKNSIISDFYHMNLVDYVFPHIDLLLVRKSMGSSLGVRSQVAQALDDVVKEVIRGTKFEWVLNSNLMEAESRLDHTKIVREWMEGSNLFYSYIIADAYLTLILGHMWMYTLILLSALVQVPLTQLSKLNLGQVAEYNFIHWLERLGFRTMVAERRKEFRKVSSLDFFRDYVNYADLFTKGKVYVKNYGVFENVVEGDFAQLYPSLMSNDTVDPTGIRVSLYVSREEVEPVKFADPMLRYKVVTKRFPVLLGYKAKKSADTMIPSDMITTIPTYGPISFLLYKMFTMRRITKKLKKRAESEGRPELVSVDQAVKILNNASYGAFSKRRGFINSVLSGYVFWKTLKILYDVIDFAEKKLKLTVLYGDTDSIFVKCKEDDAIRMFPDAGSVRESCWRWFTEHIVPQINNYVKTNYGKELELSPEDVFDLCVYPKSKHSNAPSKKSYICVNKERDNYKIEVIKGDFYKATAPDGLKDRISEFYAEILKNKPEKREEVIRIAEKVLSSLPPHKYFMKKTIDTFESETVDTDKTYEFKLKKINKPFHYAALHVLFIQNEKVPEVRKSRAVQVLSDVTNMNNSRSVVYIIDAERLVREKGNVVVYFLPSNTPNTFTVFIDYDEKRDIVVVHRVTVRKKVEIVSERRGDVVRDVGYKVDEMYVEMELPRTKVLADALESAGKYIVDDVVKKLLPALHSSQQSTLSNSPLFSEPRTMGKMEEDE
ncbi:MAG: DNA polymerase domain-containing protein [Ignisphaera sp.]